jgi:hypothetical protein
VTVSSRWAQLRQARADFESRHGYAPTIVRMSTHFYYQLVEEDSRGGITLDFVSSEMTVCGMKLECTENFAEGFELQ